MGFSLVVTVDPELPKSSLFWASTILFCHDYNGGVFVKLESNNEDN